MTLKEKINTQLESGIPRSEIYSSLIEQGHSIEDIDNEFALITNEPQKKSNVGIVFGVLYLLIVIVQIVIYTQNSDDSSSSIRLLSIITGIILMIFWFTKKKD